LQKNSRNQRESRRQADQDQNMDTGIVPDTRENNSLLEKIEM
jgi:hypothetical protein